MSNIIVAENQLQGTPESVWQISGPQSTSIEGFATEISTDVGQTVSFAVDTDALAYRLEIYRLGWYGGDGARLVSTITHNGSGTSQPAPLEDPITGLVDAGNWSVTDSWQVPSDAVSGVYVANLIREDGIEGRSQIPFVIRNSFGNSDIVLQTSDTTWQAYNSWGGASLYSDPDSALPSRDRAYAVSYNRPTEIDRLLITEYPAIRWLERNGYDVTYITGVDTARDVSLLTDHKVFIDVGHDEYWSTEQRANIEAARDAGVNLAFWTGNEGFWRTRWDPETNYRTMITYKEALGGAVDPDPVWTGLWRDPNAVGGPQPENALTGTLFMVLNDRSTISVSDSFADLRFWENTSVAGLSSGEIATLGPGTLGWEWNIDADNGFRPAGLIQLSSTTVNLAGDARQILNYPAVGLGEVTHSLTLYRAPSGALVFSAGTILWAQNLDGANVDRDAQQAMVNLFADMGVQPASIQSDLVSATQSSDRIAPTSSITFISTATSSQEMTVHGIAGDVGGVVAAVEVSIDGARTWHPTSGTTEWTYTFVADATDNFTFLSRAVDDSLNIGVTIGSGGVLTFSPHVRSEYTVTHTSPSGPVTVTGPVGSGSYSNLDGFHFLDGELTFDVSEPFAVAYRMYDTAFDRLPDTRGLNNWGASLESGLSLDKMASAFSASAEFLQTYGALSNRGFVEQLYRNALDREGDEEGIANWTGFLDRGSHSRGQLLVGFSESAEHIEKLRPAVEAGLWDQDEAAASVARFYYAALERAPDADGLANWVSAVRGGATLGSVADGFANAAEFQQQYGTLNNQGYVEQLYHNVLDRDGDAQGLANWTNELNAGHLDRGDVLLGFSESLEFQLKTQPVIDPFILLA